MDASTASQQDPNVAVLFLGGLLLLTVLVATSSMWFRYVGLPRYFFKTLKKARQAGIEEGFMERVEYSVRCSVRRNASLDEVIEAQSVRGIRRAFDEAMKHGGQGT